VGKATKKKLCFVSRGKLLEEHVVYIRKTHQADPAGLLLLAHTAASVSPL
jgi:hypothetical protein